MKMRITAIDRWDVYASDRAKREKLLGAARELKWANLLSRSRVEKKKKKKKKE